MTSLPQLIRVGDGLQGLARAKTAADLGLEALVEQAPPRGLYLHVPFCFHKCHYCDFYSLVDDRNRQPAFTQRLIGELQAGARYMPRALETIFAGGGTPTLLIPELWVNVLRAMGESLRFAPDLEFTVEANPETLSEALLDVLVSGAGCGPRVNRISIGAQSFDPRHLKTLERWHDPAAVARAVALLRAAGIVNFNLDLIFAIPGQTLEQWLADLEQALAFEPAHLSCYGLTYEPSTPLTAKLRAGTIRRTDEDLEAAMFEATIERLQRAGYVHYEISNWAMAGRECRHNLIYWDNESWWALGPSASGHVAGVRWRNAPRLEEYLAAAPLPRVVDAERLDDQGRIGETLMLGLRLLSGMELARVEALLATASGSRHAQAIERHVRGGLLERGEGRLRFSARGLMLADTVLADLVQDVSDTIIIVPCYNEAKRLDVETFKRYAAAGAHARFLFCDDGSTDATAEMLESLRQSNPAAFSVLTQPRNQGKAETVRLGLLAALEERPGFVGFWDADLSTPLEEVARFREIFDERPEIEMVFGSRVNLLGRSVKRKLVRHYIGRVFATAVSAMLRLPIYDTQCGAKIFRVTDGLAELFRERFISRWIFDVEILARTIAARRGTEKPPASRIIYEQPLVRWFDVDGSKLRLRDMVIVSLDFMRIYSRYVWRRR